MKRTYEERKIAKSCAHWDSCFRIFRLTHGQKSYYPIDEILDCMMCLEGCEFYEVRETRAYSCKGCKWLDNPGSPIICRDECARAKVDYYTRSKE